MTVSYSYIYTGTDSYPNTKYKHRMSLNMTQTNDIWKTYYGPIRNCAFISNDRGFCYIQSSVTNKYLSRNNYGALVWWDNATPNYSDWLVTIGDAYKTTLLNLKSAQHSYLVWNKNSDDLNWWSNSAGSDEWCTYWGVTEGLPGGENLISVGNNGIVKEYRSKIYCGRTAIASQYMIYVIDKKGFDRNNPIMYYNYFNDDCWHYGSGRYGDTENYSYIVANYTLKRGSNSGVSYASSLDPSKFYWVRKDGSVSYLDMLSTVDVHFVGNDGKKSTNFQIGNVSIPIKNAEAATETKSLGTTIKMGTSAGTTLVSSCVTVSMRGNGAFVDYDFSPFQAVENKYTSLTPSLSYKITYPVNQGVKNGSTYYNTYMYMVFSYVNNDNNMSSRTFCMTQPQNPLYGVISYDSTFSYVGKGYYASVIELPEGLNYDSYNYAYMNPNVKVTDIAISKSTIEIETYSIQKTAPQTTLIGLNLTVGDDKLNTYPAQYSFTCLETLSALNVFVAPFKYTTYNLTGTFKHFKQDAGNFIDVTVYDSETNTTNWNKKNDFKVYLNKENQFKFPLNDVIAPPIIDIPIKDLDSSIHTDATYDFEYNKSHSLFLTNLKKYNLVIGSSKTDLQINQEARRINQWVNGTNRTSVYYKNCPLFISGVTSMGSDAKYIAFSLFKYSKKDSPAVIDIRWGTLNIDYLIGYFNAVFMPVNEITFRTNDVLGVELYNQKSSSEKITTYYEIKDTCDIPYLIYYVNSLGGVDVIPLNECSTSSKSVTSSTYTKKVTITENGSNAWLNNYNGSLQDVEEMTVPYNLKTSNSYSCKTPFLNDNELALHSELFDSMVVFLYNVATKEFKRVTVSTNSYTKKTKKQNSGKPVQMSFNVTEAVTNLKTI